MDCSAHHGLDSDNNLCGTCTLNANKFIKQKDATHCQPCGYQSNYGTNYNNQADTIEYFTGRIAVFTHDIMKNRIDNGTVLTFGAKGESFFKDCENKRECDDDSNPSPCNNSTLCDDSSIF